MQSRFSVVLPTETLKLPLCPASGKLSEYTAWEAKEHIGETAIVTGRVLQVVNYPGTCITYLFGADSDSGPPLFLLRLKENAAGMKFDTGSLMNRMVAVSGTIRETSPPSIEIESGSQIITQRKYNLEELDAAIARARQALASNPRDANAYYRRGMAQEKKGELQQSNDGYRAAIDDYKQSIKLDSSKAEALVRIGDCYAALQDYKSAQTAYDQGINASPLANKILTESIAKEKMGACSAAIHAIQKLTGFEPNNAALYYREATLYVRNKQSKGANENFRLAAELEPANATYANAASRQVAPFRRQMTAEEMKDGLIKGGVILGATAVTAAMMGDASAVCGR